MEMQQVRYFLALAQTLNFTRAAEECNVSQPALTRAIQALEAELGGTLLVRERQHTHLTELGSRMLPLMRQCYESALSAKALARAVKTGEVAPLALAVSRAINLALLAKPLRELMRVSKGLQLKLIRVSGGELVELLKSGEAELGIGGPQREAWDRLDTWPLFAEPFEVIVNRDHEFARRNEIDLRELNGEPFLLCAACEMADDLARLLGEHGIKHESAHQVETDHDVVALLEASLGVSLAPASGPQAEGLRRLRIKDLALRRTVTIYGVAGRRRSPAANTLLNLLRATDWSRYAN
jgi:DNA-binding transcriptional LysR family regulator